MIPYGKQTISEEDISEVERVLRSDYLTQGPRVERFESDLATYVGANHCVAVNSATSALHLSCLALDVGPGDLVWTSAISFVASANAARYCGADVDFVDIDSGTSNISVPALAEKLHDRRNKGKTMPKVVIPVAMAGQSADMSEIRSLADEFGFRIIEDASHALGATYQGQKVGSLAFSDIVVFSFHPVKMITTGEGGACTTNDPEIARRIQRLRSHGITRDAAEMQSSPPGGWYYEQTELGFNYRITDIQCALGSSQLGRLDEFLEKRRYVADLYMDNLEYPWLEKPLYESDRSSSHHLFIVKTCHDSPFSRNRLIESLRGSGIWVNLHYIPIYRHPYYWNMGDYDAANFPNAEHHFSNAISLPIFPDLREQDVAHVIELLGADLGFQNLF